MKRSWTPLLMAVTVGVLGAYWIYYSVNQQPTPQTTFYPTTDFARSTHDVYTFVNILLLVIFLVVEAVLVWVLFRFRKEDAKPGDPLPEQVHGNTKIEVGLTLATTVLVIILFVPSCQQIQFTQVQVPDDPMVVEVVGKQWWWEFYIPEYDVLTANEVHIPTGRPVRFDLTSTDVIHAFWIPRLGGKRDTVPGRSQFIWMTPEEPGWYDGQCAEFCGTSHALMSMRVKVETPQDFEKWVAQQKAPSDPAAMGGFGNFAQAGCIACHQTFVNDKTVRNQLGPNLKKVATRSQIAAGILDNNAENMRAWIADPQHFKPDALMDIPAMQCKGPGDPDPCCRDVEIGNCLADETVDQLVSYLQMLN